MQKPGTKSRPFLPCAREFSRERFERTMVEPRNHGSGGFARRQKSLQTL